MLPPNNHHDRGIWFVIFVLLSFFILSFIFFEYQILALKKNLNILSSKTPTVLSTLPPYITPTPFLLPTPTPTPSSPVASFTPIVKVIISSPSVPKITYIPLIGGQTQNTDWTNVSGSSFTLNINDYGSNAYVIWDANIRVDNANGQTFVRIFDITHGIAVNGSEISVTNTNTSTDVTSGSLQFWQGNNNYVVQIKSLNSSTAFIDSGRIKINY